MENFLFVIHAIGGFINVAIAAAVLYTAHRVKLGFPPVIWLLTSYFVLRATDRFTAPDGIFPYTRELDATTDVLLLTMLVIIAFTAGTFVRALLADRSHAQYRAAEYARAQNDYQIIIRHRLANPLTVVKGAAITLSADPADSKIRKQLAEVIVDAAETIEALSLEPRRISDEEHELNPEVAPDSRRNAS